MPFFDPTTDPGSNFPELLRRSGLGPAIDAVGTVDVPHATTCVALRYADGVVMAGDRRATSGNLISHRTMEKVVQADRYSGVAIAGAAGPARYYSMPDSQTRVGFISPHSNNFCHLCNRVRVTAEGRLLLCLGNEHSVDLRAVLRSPGYTPELLKRTIVNAMAVKPERHHFDNNGAPDIVRFMNMTGG